SVSFVEVCGRQAIKGPRPSSTRWAVIRRPTLTIIATASRTPRHPGPGALWANLATRCGRLWTGNRDEDDHAIFGPDCSGDVTLAGEVFRQFDAARSDLNC